MAAYSGGAPRRITAAVPARTPCAARAPRVPCISRRSPPRS